MANQDKNTLVIGAGFTIDGDVRGKGTLLLGGVVKGSVTADKVRVSETGVIYGNIDCAQLDIAGKLNGAFAVGDLVVRSGAAIAATADLVAKGTCLIHGTVNANLKANQIKVDAGGKLFGNLQANELDLFGLVNGALDVVDIVIRHTGRVEGNLQYGSLAMERGGDISGQLQRKQAPTSATNSGPTIKGGAPKSYAIMSLPVAMLHKKMRNPQLRPVLSMVDGTPLPDWIDVSPDADSLLLEKSALQTLQQSGQRLNLRLQLGGESLIFSLPPDGESKVG